MNEQESQYLYKGPCDACGSSDANAHYSNGTTFCFSCQKPGREEGATVSPKQSDEPREKSTAAEVWSRGSCDPLRKRGITEETTRKYGYKIVDHGGKTIQVAPYYKDGQIVALKTRDANKNFSVIGDHKKPTLFGQQLFNGGKRVIVTEGEIDCLSVSQVLGNKWPVVSLPSGAQSAAKTFQNNYEWLDSFEEIILMFDNDEPGQQASAEAAEVLPVGKVKIATLPLKDANEMLVAGRVEELMKAQYNARPYRPDGILDGTNLWDLVEFEEEVPSIPYPWKGLNDKLRGIRTSELITLTSGSGMGKSAVAREIAYHMILQEKNVGMIFLEESVKRTALGLMGLHINHPLHLGREGITQEQIKKAYDGTIGTGKAFFYDHFGSTDVDNLLAKIRYMAKALDCKVIILDHLSIVVSGLEGNEDERRTIDRAMTMLRTLVEETKITLFLISHLKRVDGAKKSHEEGGVTSLSHLRGSQAIAQLSDAVIGIERNQQGENPNQAIMRVLKNRFSGDTGVATTLNYDKQTGRLREEDIFGGTF